MSERKLHVSGNDRQSNGTVLESAEEVRQGNSERTQFGETTSLKLTCRRCSRLSYFIRIRRD